MSKVRVFDNRFTFVRFEHKGTFYDWMIRINNFFDLLRYYERENHTTSIVLDTIDGKPSERSLPYQQLSEIRGDSLASTLSRLHQGRFECQMELLEEYGRFYINHNGGYFSAHDIVELQVVKFNVWPDTAVKVTRWPKGNHYYAKVGSLNVVVDGIQKWNTPEAAYEAAFKFMEESDGA